MCVPYQASYVPPPLSGSAHEQQGKTEPHGRRDSQPHVRRRSAPHGPRDLPVRCVLGPVQIILALVLLYNFLGPSIFAGFGVMILLIPVNFVIAAKGRSYQVLHMFVRITCVRV